MPVGSAAAVWQIWTVPVLLSAALRGTFETYRGVCGHEASHRALFLCSMAALVGLGRLGSRRQRC